MVIANQAFPGNPKGFPLDAAAPTDNGISWIAWRYLEAYLHHGMSLQISWHGRVTFCSLFFCPLFLLLYVSLPVLQAQENFCWKPTSHSLPTGEPSLDMLPLCWMVSGHPFYF